MPPSILAKSLHIYSLHINHTNISLREIKPEVEKSKENTYNKMCPKCEATSASKNIEGCMQLALRVTHS